MRKTIIAASAAALLALAGCSSDDGGVDVDGATEAVASEVDKATEAAGDAASDATSAAGAAGETTAAGDGEGEGSGGESTGDGSDEGAGDGSGEMGTIALADGSEVEVPAGIAQKYSEIQGSTDHLGAPVGEAQAVAGGQMLEFEGGTIIQNPDGQAFLVQGEILNEYMSNGGPESDLGFPTTDETPQEGGFISTFDSGEITYDIATEESTVKQN